MDSTKRISVQTTIQAPIEKVWKIRTEPEHIKEWNHASDDWHTPFAENDLRVGGKFVSRMEAKDGSFGFDFGGIYDEVKFQETLAYTMEDGRKVNIIFHSSGDQTEVIETFDAEESNPAEVQQQGWQAILDNFKKYAEKATI